MSSSINPSAAGHHSKSYRKSSAEANGSSGGGGGGGGGGAASDDSMHEKYFKSVENTPLSRRRHTTNAKGHATGTGTGTGTGGGGGASGSNTATSTAGSGSSGHKNYSSDSSPQSPISPQTKSSRQAKTSATNPPPQLQLQHSPRMQDPQCGLDLLSLERMSLVGKTAPISPSGGSDNLGMLTHSSRGSNDSAARRQKSNNSTATRSQSHHYPGQGSLRHSASSSLDKRGYQVLHSSTGSTGGGEKRDSRRSKTQQQQQHNLQVDNSDVEYDNGNISPLYSNCGQEMPHLLPLRHYIIEQAKIFGRYEYGGNGAGDSDSYHSDSQSEHSLSGHEPDNEDSDGGSDTHGGYLEHNYGMIDDYANMGDSVSYYAYQFPPYDPAGREDM